MGGRKPEIRDKISMEAIRFAAISKGVEKILAGIVYNSANNIFRLTSDNVNVRYKSPFKFLEYGGYYKQGTYQAINWEDKYSVPQSSVVMKCFVSDKFQLPINTTATKGLAWHEKVL